MVCAKTSTPAADRSGSIQASSSRIRQIDLRDVETVRAAIRETYGFEVTAQYAADLVSFIEEVTREQPRD